MTRRGSPIVLALLAACQFDAGGVAVPSNMLGSVGSSGAADEESTGDGLESDTTAASSASADGGSTGVDPATSGAATGALNDSTERPHDEGDAEGREGE